MSKEVGTLPQAAQMLDVIAQQKLSTEEVQTLLSGPLVALAQAAKQRTIPPLAELRRFLGLERYTRPISDGHDLVLPATDGKRTITQARDLFAVGIDPNFHNWGLNTPCAATLATPVAVEEQVKEGTFTFAVIYGGFERSLRELSFTTGQFVAFVETFREWLSPEGWATFFLLRKEVLGKDDEFFVARVLRNDVGRLFANVRRLARGLVWGVEYRDRVVLPQLASKGAST